MLKESHNNKVFNCDLAIEDLYVFKDTIITNTMISTAHTYEEVSERYIQRCGKNIFERKQRWLLWISIKRCILGPQTTATLLTETHAHERGNAHAQFVKRTIIPV